MSQMLRVEAPFLVADPVSYARAAMATIGIEKEMDECLSHVTKVGGKVLYCVICHLGCNTLGMDYSRGAMETIGIQKATDGCLSHILKVGGKVLYCVIHVCHLGYTLGMEYSV